MWIIFAWYVGGVRTYEMNGTSLTWVSVIQSWIDGPWRSFISVNIEQIFQENLNSYDSWPCNICSISHSMFGVEEYKRHAVYIVNRNENWYSFLVIVIYRMFVFLYMWIGQIAAYEIDISILLCNILYLHLILPHLQWNIMWCIFTTATICR